MELLLLELEKKTIYLLKQNAALEEALLGLLDGLDSNYDERCGLTNDQWQKRIKDARLILGGDK